MDSTGAERQRRYIARLKAAAARAATAVAEIAALKRALAQARARIAQLENPEPDGGTRNPRRRSA